MLKLFEYIPIKKLNNLIYWHLGSEITDKNLLTLPLDEDNLLNKMQAKLLAPTMNIEKLTKRKEKKNV